MSEKYFYLVVVTISLMTMLIFLLPQKLTTPWGMSVTLFAIGALLGATLNYFQFGFSSSFRTLLNHYKTAGMRAIILMLIGAILLFSPLLAMQNLNSVDYYGFIRPLSVSIPISAFLFGIGMQISGGCTSGTLNRVGQMQTLALPTLFFMLLGGTIAAAFFGEWRHLPSLAPFALQKEFSWPVALLLQMTVLTLLYKRLLTLEKRHHQHIEPLTVGHNQPLLKAALLLAVLNALLFLTTGSPWSISAVFPYWGTAFLEVFNNPIDWAFWDYAIENQASLALPWWQHSVSLTTLGVILGALTVSLFHPRKKLLFSMPALLMSLLGGLLMGFGAVLASGCNIGAFFSGIASGSIHGWVWFIFALGGNAIGLMLRKTF